MASSMFSSASIASINCASPTQASMVAPFTGLKSSCDLQLGRRSSRLSHISNHFPLNHYRRKLITFFAWDGFLDWKSSWSTYLFTVGITNLQDTMMVDIGQCGSCPCWGALIQLKF
ncbi:hypothetical protein Dsin_028786 [Dipteronia sinensis]|uniref:Ribulose-1,5-bisphosphate carboxylase small subunit N-terminal domain-containing protein n=1 Tax=Dipteronia sinensis TaxID=43782 RepID=A0AAD9ZR87_9ROSI|nr:hypothetical protein Dsin_028786 [Dipteronia sinensis]